MGRIRFFYEQLMAGRLLDPLVLSGRVLGDGHHRLAAARLAGAALYRQGNYILIQPKK
jgi:hypothetical protein